MHSEKTKAALAAKISSLSPEQRQELALKWRRKLLTRSETSCSGEEPVTNSYPLSSAQKLFWFRHHQELDIPVCNIPAAIRLSGPLDLSIFKLSLNHVVQRHDALRTHFEIIDGLPRQVCLPLQSVTLPIIDLSRVPLAQRDIEMQRLVDAELKRPFALDIAPMMRTTLIRLKANEYVLILCIHHIIADGWSLGVLLQELMTAYKAFREGRSSALPVLTFQYRDYVNWQNEANQVSTYEHQLTYWKKKLAGMPNYLNLTTDRPRPPVRTSRGTTRNYAWTRTLSVALKNLCKREGVTLYMLMLAALNTLLYRYTNQTDILVGAPVGNRKPLETEPLIGLFLNMLVLRTDLSGDPTFQELLKRVRDLAVGAYNNADLPFADLVAALNPKRNISFTPLFQVMLSHNNAPSGTTKQADLSWQPILANVGSADCDVAVMFSDTEEGIGVRIEYSTELFEPETIDRLVGHLETLLSAVVACPKLRISTIPILTRAEQHQLLEVWSGKESNQPQYICINEMFEAQVKKTPDAIALTYNEAHLTYAELNAKANRLARQLIEVGIQLDEIVGLCIENSSEWIVGVLGILKAGGAYLPLDPRYPKERLAFMIKDASLQILLTQDWLLEKIPDSSAQPICITSENSTSEPENNDENLGRVISPANLAYVIYTSGSTGTPKGSLNTHAGLSSRLVWKQSAYPLDTSDHVLQTCPFSFDVSIWEILGCLVSGARLVITPPYVQRDPTLLAQLTDKNSITVLHFVPSMLQIMMNEPAFTGCRNVRLVFCAGEALPFSLTERFFDLMQADLVNAYGPSEACIAVTAGACWPKRADRLVTLGKPLDGVKIYILDKNKSLVPIGVPGEIYIGGVGLMRGYLNRPQLTEAKFTTYPFSNEPSARLLKTGDLARWLHDGTIDFLGREDFQAKIRGFRIELKEIEFVLDEHPKVQQVAVIVREDIPGDKRIVAYVVINKGITATNGELRNFLSKKLPEHAIPSFFVFLDSMPLNANDKIDRKALSESRAIFEAQIGLEELPNQSDTFAEENNGEIEQWQKVSNIADWFYVPQWQRSPISSGSVVVTTQDWLIFADQLGIGARLVEQLAANGRHATVVERGEAFECIDDYHFIINPYSSCDCEQLVAALSKRGRSLGTIVHLWSVTAEDPRNANIEVALAQSQESLELGFYNLISLAQALGNHGSSESLQIRIVSNKLHQIISEERLDPIKATVLGACHVIPQEFNNITCQSIDVDVSIIGDTSIATLSEHLLAEFEAEITDPLVAYRGSERWVRTFKAQHIDEIVFGELRLRQRGVYLITGGLGGVGLVLARYLACTVKAKLILLGRSGLPHRNDWESWLKGQGADNRVSQRILAIQQIEALGSEVLLIQSDVTDIAEMTSAMDTIRKYFGRIDGAIHAAGVPAVGIIQRKTCQEAARVLAPKVQGSLILNALLKEQQPDFLILCSSLVSILGGIGNADYCSANAFLDAFAHSNAGSHGTPTMSINWGMWQEVGMAAEGNLPSDLRALHEKSLKFGMTNEEGMEAFRRILACKATQIIVSTQELQALIADPYYYQDITKIEKFNELNHSGISYLRPALDTEFVSAREQIEVTISEIWRMVLRVESVGIYDDFFALGGHSILAMQVVNRISNAFNTIISVQELFDNPTVASMSKLVCGKP